MGLEIIILAAGKGTRMCSEVPKVLHQLAGKPMLMHVIETAKQLVPDAIHVVVGYGAGQIKEAVQDTSIHWCLQAQQCGTGDAVLQALPAIDEQQTVLVLYADVPLLKQATLQRLRDKLRDSQLVVLSAVLENPTGMGRIVREQSDRSGSQAKAQQQAAHWSIPPNPVQAIIEHQDADPATRQIKEVNTGVLVSRCGDLKRWLASIGHQNTQREYYLTDCIALAVREGKTVETVLCEDQNEMLGVNNKVQLAQVERCYQRAIANDLMSEGVTLMDPARIDVRGTLTVGKEVLIDINSVFIGDVSLGKGVRIGANAVIINSRIEADTKVHANCHIENARIGEACELGPFARIRPDSELAAQVKIGNFVEIKKVNIRTGSKISHLSYIGDTVMGENVNVGAGTVTCNYDGVDKHCTTIGDDVFIGSDTQIIAPVKIAEGATIGAGSTITKDAPKDRLTLSRSRQTTIDGWQRPDKRKK